MGQQAPSDNGNWINITDPFGKLHHRWDPERDLVEIRVRGKTITHDLKRLREEAVRRRR